MDPSQAAEAADEQNVRPQDLEFGHNVMADQRGKVGAESAIHESGDHVQSYKPCAAVTHSDCIQPRLDVESKSSIVDTSVTAVEVTEKSDEPLPAAEAAQHAQHTPNGQQESGTAASKQLDNERSAREFQDEATVTAKTSVDVSQAANEVTDQPSSPQHRKILDSGKTTLNTDFKTKQHEISRPNRHAWSTDPLKRATDISLKHVDTTSMQVRAAEASSPGSQRSSKHAGSDRHVLDRSRSSPSDSGRKRHREQGASDALKSDKEYRHRKDQSSDCIDHQRSSATASNQELHPAWRDNPAYEPYARAESGLAAARRRDGNAADGVGSETDRRKRSHSEHSRQSSGRRDDPKGVAGRAVNHVGEMRQGQDAAVAEGHGPSKALKEKRVGQKVNLSFDEELGEGEDAGEKAPQFNLAASTASRFEQERQKGHARSSAPAAVASVVANNLRMHEDDAGPQLGSIGSGGSDGDAPRSLGRFYIGVAQAKVHRPYMEDRHTVVASYRPSSSSGPTADDGICRCFAAVYDGHNGCHAADLAASRLHLMIASDPALRMYAGSTGPPSLVAQEEQAIGSALRKAFREIDDDILRTAREECLRDGSTALLVLRLGQVLYAAHAGDSRAVLCRGGVAERLTEDHKPNLPVERHRILNLGGRVEFQRCWRVIVEPREGRPGSALAVSRSLGDLEFKEPQRLVECEPDVGRTELKSGDRFVVLATDGLWDMLSDQDAVDCAEAAMQEHMKRSGKGLSDAAASVAAEALIDEAVRRGTMDNTTVIILLMQWD